jgi:DnaJ homolog subfamily C member 13
LPYFLFLLSGTHENPELIWNDEAREKVSVSVKDLKEAFYATQRDDRSALWNVSSDLSVPPEETWTLIF